MYQVIPEKERNISTINELEKLYPNKWMYLTNCTFSKGNLLASGVVVIIADERLEGYETGLYDQFNVMSSGVLSELDLVYDIPDITSVL